MPVDAPFLPRLSADEFRPVDYAVMQHVFASQTELGRFGEEHIYKADVTARLAEAGIRVRREVPIRVSCRDFAQQYFIDLLVEEAFIYEFKTVSELAGAHDVQLLTYLLLANAARGKLVNLRPESVEARFVNAPADLQSRRNWVVVRDELTHAGALIRERMVEMLDDWGVFLEVTLYTEALVHFCGGELNVLRVVPLKRKGLLLGHQRFHIASDGAAFRVTAFAGELKAHEQHFRRLLAVSPLPAMHWVNLDGRDVSFVSLLR